MEKISDNLLPIIIILLPITILGFSITSHFIMFSDPEELKTFNSTFTIKIPPPQEYCSTITKSKGLPQTCQI